MYTLFVIAEVATRKSFAVICDKRGAPVVQCQLLDCIHWLGGGEICLEFFPMTKTLRTERIWGKMIADTDLIDVYQGEIGFSQMKALRGFCLLKAQRRIPYFNPPRSVVQKEFALLWQET